MDEQILGIHMPCGHPFSLDQINKTFDVKTNITRWRKSSDLKKVFSRSKNATISDDSVLSLKCVQKHGERTTNIILTLPFLRKEVLSEWQSHWPDTAAPELYAINRYCKKHYEKPYFSVSGECLRKDMSEKELHSVSNHELTAVSTYFAQTLQNSPIDIALLITNVFSHIHADPDDVLAHHALWAICSAYDCSLPIQFLLHRRPELLKYYDYLDWYAIDSVFSDEDPIKSLKTGYEHSINFYTHFPRAIHTGFIDETIKSHAEKLLSHTAKRVFSSNQDSVYHSHHDLSDYARLIFDIKMTQNALDLYFNTFFDDIVSMSLTDIDRYIEERRLCAEKFKETTGEDKLPKLNSTQYEEVKRLLFSEQFKKPTMILNLESEEFKSAIAELRASLKEPFEILSKLSKEYSTLASDPIKNRKELTELLVKIDTQVNDSITDIEEADELFLMISNQIHQMIEKLKNKSSEGSSAKINELQSQLDKRDNELFEKEAIIEKLNSKLEKANSNSNPKTQDVIIRVEEAKAIGTVIKDASITPETVLKVLAEMYPDHLNILESAYDSAREVDGFRLTKRMFDLINTLVTQYLPSIIQGNPDTEARKCFGIKAYAANESKTVSSSPKLMHYRQFKVDGKRVEMQQHLNIGVAHDQLQTMRIYFKIIDNKAYIGYAGKHLPNK